VPSWAEFETGAVPLAAPRRVVHSLVTTASGGEGDVKSYGRATEVGDPEERARHGDALFERTGWRPTGHFHLFTVDIDEVGSLRVEAEDGAGRHRMGHRRAGEELGAPTTRPGTS